MSGNLTCKFCNSVNAKKNGKQKYNGKQTYLCKDCGKSWSNGNDERVKYDSKKRDKIVELYLENNGIRSIERMERIPNTSVIKILKKAGREIKDKVKKDIDELLNIENKKVLKQTIEIVEIDELCAYVKKTKKI